MRSPPFLRTFDFFILAPFFLVPSPLNTNRTILCHLRASDHFLGRSPSPLMFQTSPEQLGRFPFGLTTSVFRSDSFQLTPFSQDGLKIYRLFSLFVSAVLSFLMYPPFFTPALMRTFLIKEAVLFLIQMHFFRLPPGLFHMSRRTVPFSAEVSVTVPARDRSPLLFSPASIAQDYSFEFSHLFCSPPVEVFLFLCLTTLLPPPHSVSPPPPPPPA